MSQLEIILILLGIALAYVGLGVWALRNPGPDLEPCPPDCEACKAEHESNAAPHDGAEYESSTPKGN